MKDVAIVGLPGSGKSTVWEAVATVHAQPGSRKANLAVVTVPDRRVAELARIVGSERVEHARVRLVDVPGFDARALGEARGADALAVVLRGFGEDADPARALSTFRSELALADLGTMERVVERAQRQAKSGSAEALTELQTARRAVETLEAERWLRDVDWEPAELRALELLTPLTLKPALHVVNLGEETGESDARVVPEPRLGIRALLEAEAAELAPEEAEALLAEYGVGERATGRFIRAVYELLDLVTFFTANAQEAHAWEVPRGTRAPGAAGAIHNDLERGFIRAEAVTFDALESAGSWDAVRDRGMLRVEGKDYIVQDGDVMQIRHSR